MAKKKTTKKMLTKTSVVEIGDEVRCDMTEYTGIVVAKCDYLFSTSRVLVRMNGTNSNGSTVEEWFDVGSLFIIQKEVWIKTEGKAHYA